MKRNLFLYLVIVSIVGMIVISGCSRERLPEVQTIGVSDITSSSVKLSATIVDDGNGHIASLGFYYSVDQGMNNKQTALYGGYNNNSTFSIYVSNLQPSTTYYFQAFAINGKGTGVGEIMSFTTSASTSSGEIGGGSSSGVVISLVDSNGENSYTFDLAHMESFSENLTLNVSAAEGISNISIMATKYNSNNQIINSQPVYIDNNYVGLQTYSCTIQVMLASSDVAGAARVVYNFTVVGNNNGQAQCAYVVNIVRPAFTEGTFVWTRQGPTIATGLEEFGLYWTLNNKSVCANIKPFSSIHLYILTSSDYAITDINTLNSKLTSESEATVYRGVSCDGSANYDDVIATVYNEKTYLIHVTGATVVNDSYNGNRTTITGSYKLWTNTDGGGTQVSLPTVETLEAIGISAWNGSAMLVGNVTSDGNATVTRGFIYGMSENNLSENVQCGTGTGIYSKTLNLLDGTQYYYKAYATNSVGTVYGEVVSFYIPEIR